MGRTGYLLLAVVLAVAAFLLWPLFGGGGASERVVVYCSVDQDQSQPVVAAFEAHRGTKVTLVGEAESARSVGVTRRLEMEKDAPVADLLWANEIMHTVALRDLGVLAPLPSGVADPFPAATRDPKGTYVAFAGRARVLLVNTKLLPDAQDWPTSVEDLVDAKWGGDDRRPAVAAPLTGTTYTHAVVTLTRDGERAQAFWRKVAERGARGEVKVVPGNGAVMRMVSDASNGVPWGLTDTDDARQAVERGDPVAVVYPDQGEGRFGTVVIPNTVALVRGGKHPAEAAALLRWLVSPESEARLAAGPIANIPLRDSVTAPPHVKRPGKDFRAASVDWDAVGRDRDRWRGFLQTLFTAK